MSEARGEDREECSWDLHKSEFCRLGAACAEGLLCNLERLQELEVLLLLIFPLDDYSAPPLFSGSNIDIGKTSPDSAFLHTFP